MHTGIGWIVDKRSSRKTGADAYFQPLLYIGASSPELCTQISHFMFISCIGRNPRFLDRRRAGHYTSFANHRMAMGEKV